MADSPHHSGELVARAILDRLDIELTPWQVKVLLFAMDNPHGYVVAMTRPPRTTHALYLHVWRARERLRRERLSSMRSSYRSRMKARQRRG
jgi:hypothetical protein